MPVQQRRGAIEGSDNKPAVKMARRSGDIVDSPDRVVCPVTAESQRGGERKHVIRRRRRILISGCDRRI